MRKRRSAGPRRSGQAGRRDDERASWVSPQAEPDGRLFASMRPRVVLLFAGVLLVLLIPWPGYGRVVASGFGAYANGVAWTLGLGGAHGARFSAPTAAEREDPSVDDWTVMLSPSSALEPGSQGIPLGTRILGYTPFAIFVALIVAAPLPARRRWAVCAVGGAILFARLAGAIALPVARVFGRFGQKSPLGLAAEIAWGSLIDQPALSYAMPLLAWWIGLLVVAPLRATAAHRKS
jgi:hypothetical protein